MDRIFDNPVPTQPQEPAVNANYPTVDLDHAASVLDSIVGADTVPDTIAYEADDPKTYVVVGESDTDTEFVTFSASGEVLPDYPNPTTKIQSVDREAGKAVDELLVSYPIKTRDEIG